MKYLIVSDIHGGALETKKALEFFTKFNCDYLIILGDLLNHGPRNKVPSTYDPMDVASLLNAYASKIICIRGNCDSEVDTMVFNFPCNAPYSYICLKDPHSNQDKKIFLTHGHLFKLDTVEQLQKIGLTPDDIVLSGHTHVSGIFKKDSGIVNINPGSTTLPKGGTQAGFALLDETQIDLYTLDGTLVESHTIFSKE